MDRFIPVDMYVPGCPPRPEQLLTALMDMQAKVKRTGTLLGTEFADRGAPTGPAPFELDELRRRREATAPAGIEVYGAPQLNPKRGRA